MNDCSEGPAESSSTKRSSQSPRVVKCLRSILGDIIGFVEGVSIARTLSPVPKSTSTVICFKVFAAGVPVIRLEKNVVPGVKAKITRLRIRTGIVNSVADVSEYQGKRGY